MNQGLGRNLLPIVAGAGCMIILLAAMTAVAEWKNAAPEVGDIAVFDASAGPAVLAHTGRLAVRTAMQRSCTLDLKTLGELGGSLVIEGRSAQTRDFVVHWAGLHTSNDSADCGSSADLLLDRHQIDLLGFVPDGYGMAGRSERLLTRHNES